MLRLGILLSAVGCIVPVWCPAAHSIRSESWAGVQASATKGPYLGQKPPGKAPEPFAPDVFGGVQFHDSPSFSRDGTEMLAAVTGNNEQFRYFRSTGGTWFREDDFPVLTGPYLGQKPPRRSPELFAPGIVSSEHASVTISRDGKEIYWAGDRIYVTRLENGKWTEPRPLPFSRAGDGDDGPKLSPNDRTLYFNSQRARHAGDNRRERVWRVERTAGGWGDPHPLGPEINDEHLHWQVSVDPEGRLYFGSERRGSKGSDDVFVAEPRNGRFAKPVGLDAAINSEDHEGSPFVSQDGRSLIFLRDSNLWVSFRGKNGLWTPARRLATPEGAVCPYVSPDGKYFFFLKFQRLASGAYAHNVYWMDASGLGLDGGGR